MKERQCVPVVEVLKPLGVKLECGVALLVESWMHRRVVRNHKWCQPRAVDVQTK